MGYDQKRLLKAAKGARAVLDALVPDMEQDPTGFVLAPECVLPNSALFHHLADAWDEAAGLDPESERPKDQSGG